MKGRPRGPGRLTLLLLELKRMEEETLERVELIAGGDVLVRRDPLMAG